MSWPSRTTVTVIVIATSLAIGMTPANAENEPAGRQQAYAAAAAEFGVPESVLLGVSYLESRWDTNAGTPSTSAGYGPMHLTDVVAANAGGTHHDHGTEDPRGDDARPALHPRPGEPDLSAPNLRTAAEAAELTGIDRRTLREDPVQNIRGGAALLADHQRDLGIRSSDPADWYGAVARYSGATDTATAAAFADEVFATMAQGVARVTDDGQAVRLAARPNLEPDTAQLDRLGLRQTNRHETECPRSLGCEWIPAPYEEFGDDYGNHDLANRPESQEIDYIIIHDTEASWETTLDLVQDPTYVSWQYSLRSADGHVAQHVKAKDVAWQAGNWYVNSKSIGLEHEGFAANPTWYTEAMYRSSAKLVRYLADKHDVPLDRAHVLGHDNVSGTIPSTVRGMHWDPGPYWDWAHYFDLLGAPFRGTGTPASGLVTIRPDYARHKPAFTGCETAGEPCAPHGSGSVILHTEPRADAPLLTDIGLHPDGSPGTMHISDHSSRMETGQRYAIADREGDWTAVWYLGQKGWFHNPKRQPTAVWSMGMVATPKRGEASIPVYGRAYPEASAYPSHVPVQAVTPLQYSLPAGQKYAVGLVTGSEYYWAVTFDATNHTVVRGKTRYVQIQFGHRAMYVNAADVDLRPSVLPL
ncbi:N-acetylmuramoyl-L-alanine amidase [Actinophytocola sp.]|uniref:N-acetylmuramoyl-L-alanine amidase n=1 Tax=Actinophytocola sp. TaxID=1872138 RepID=UPI003D6B603A